MATVQVYDAMPSDEELCSFCDAEDYANNVLFEESLAQVRIEPEMLPLRVVTVTYILTHSCIAAVVIYAMFTEALGSFEWLLIPVIFFVGLLPFAILYEVMSMANQEQERQGPFLVWDHSESSILLHRQNITLPLAKICEVIDYRGWHKTGTGWSTESDWKHEVTILTKTDAGQYLRHSLVCCNSSRRLRHIAISLSKLLNVPHRSLR